MTGRVRCRRQDTAAVGGNTHFVWLLLVVDEVFLHVEQRFVVVHVLGQFVIIWVLLQEGVGRCHRFLQVVEL